MRNVPKFLLGLLLLTGPAAFADMFSITGYLDPTVGPALPSWAQRVGFDLGPAQVFPSEHTNVVLADFSLSLNGPLTIQSLGFAGTGAGIDPYITLFSGTTADPGNAEFVLEHSPGGDFVFNTPSLNAGSYVLAISAWNNFGCPSGLFGCTLADQFSGLANLPFGHDTFFDIRVSGDVVVPEPRMILPLALAVGLAYRVRFRKRA